MKYIHGFFMAFGMFCAIPCPYRPWNEKARNLMLVFLPFVGLVIGLLWYLIYLVMDFMNLPVSLQTAVLMLYPFFATGFIHLDGFMDTCDAILSRRPLEEKLRILKDSHTGAFAVISLASIFIMSYAGMSAALNGLTVESGKPMAALILIPVISRCCSATAVLVGKPLGHSQYSGEFRKETNKYQVAVVMFICLATFLTAFLLGTLTGVPYKSILIVLAATVIAYVISMIGAKNQLGGVSGDLAGYALTIAETFAIVALGIV